MLVSGRVLICHPTQNKMPPETWKYYDSCALHRSAGNGMPQKRQVHPRKTTMEPKNWWFGSMFFPTGHFQVPAVSFRGFILLDVTTLTCVAIQRWIPTLRVFQPQTRWTNTPEFFDASGNFMTLCDISECHSANDIALLYTCLARITKLGKRF